MILSGAIEPADTVPVDGHRMRTTSDTSFFHDQVRAIAAARILMSMRNGQPDATAAACRHGRDRGKVYRTVSHAATPRKHHVRFRCTVVTDDPKVEIHFEVIRKRRNRGLP